MPVSASAFDRSHYFVLHNEGPAACALPLHPRVILVEQGRTVPVRFTSEGSSFHASHVPPGGLATFALTPERTGCITADRVVAHVATTTTAVFDEPGLKVCRGTRVSVSQFRVAVPAGH